MWSEVACLLEVWAPPQDWREVEVTPEAVEVSLIVIRRSFEKQSAHEAVGTVSWPFPKVLKKSTDEKNVILKEIQEMQHENASCKLLWIHQRMKRH